MSRMRPTILVAVALVAASVLMGCGAGQVASTAEQVSNATGGNAEVGDIAVRTAVIEFGGDVEGGAVYSRGTDAPLSMTIVNEGGAPDRLVSATAEIATSVEITGDGAVPGGRSLVVGGADTEESGEAAEGGAPVGTAPPRPEDAAGTGATAVLTGLRDDVRAGISYPITLVFERAGPIVVAVPVDGTPAAREETEGGE